MSAKQRREERRRELPRRDNQKGKEGPERKGLGSRPGKEGRFRFGRARGAAPLTQEPRGMCRAPPLSRLGWRLAILGPGLFGDRESHEKPADWRECATSPGWVRRGPGWQERPAPQPPGGRS